VPVIAVTGGEPRCTGRQDSDADHPARAPG
jgi:hypothetical protein